MRKLIHFARYVTRTMYAFTRTRNLRWATTVASSECPLKQVARHSSGHGIWLRELNLGIQAESDLFLLNGYGYVRRLQFMGGRFENNSDGASGVSFTLGEMTTRLSTWDDLYILIEIYVEGAYRFVGASPSIIIDIGANVGHATLYFANRFPEARIFAFEPVPETFHRLSQNVEMNPRLREQIKLFNFGLAERDGTASVEFSAVIPGRVGLFALPEDVTRRGPTVACEIQLRDSGQVLGQILGKLMLGTVMLKIDCEGAEYQIIRSLDCSEAFSQFDYVLMEWHRRVDAQRPEELCDALQRNGFVSFLLGDTAGAGGMVYGVRSQHAPRGRTSGETATSLTVIGSSDS